MRRFGLPFISMILMAFAVLSAPTARESLFAGSADAQSAQTTCSQSDMVTPTGQVSPSSSGDPLIPTYCINASPQAPTRVTGANDWVDTFGVQGQARFNDGDMGYRVFDAVGGSSLTTRHLVVEDHWIDDNRGPNGGGAFVRPDRTFRFENGKLVVEGDVSAAKDVYGGDFWAEIDVTLADHPDINPPDAPEQAYAYGHFKGFPTFGCRLQAARTPVCAGFTGTTLGFQSSQDQAPCYSLVPDRLWELSFFQDCGDNFGGTHSGGFPDSNKPASWRTCSAQQDYDTCLDRFRVELTQHSMVWYVNGIKYFEDTGWDDPHSLRDGLVNGSVYVYFADWGAARSSQPVRFHWERLAINPHDAAGNILPPSASPTFGGGTDPTPTPTNTPVPAATNTPTAIATNTPTAVATSTPTAVATNTPTAVPTSTPTSAPTRTPTPTPTTTPAPTRTVAPTGTQTVSFDDLSNPGRPLNGQYPTGVIDWGSGQWWLSGPYGGFKTNSVSLTEGGRTASFAFVARRQLVQLDATNGGSLPTVISINCAGQLTKQVPLLAGQTSTIQTGWTGKCSSVSISATNGWETNFKNLVVQ